MSAVRTELLVRSHRVTAVRAEVRRLVLRGRLGFSSLASAHTGSSSGFLRRRGLLATAPGSGTTPRGVARRRGWAGRGAGGRFGGGGRRRRWGRRGGGAPRAGGGAPGGAR